MPSGPLVHVTFDPLPGMREVLTAEGFRLDIHSGPYPQSRICLLEHVSSAEGILCSILDRIDAELIAKAPRLRAVSQFGVGIDNIDLAAAAPKRLTVTNTPDVLTDATADLVWALLLAAARRVGEGERLIRRGGWMGWEPGQLLGAQVTGATLGIVGAGRIGTATALRARGFGMRVLYTSRSVNAELESAVGARRVGLDDLLRESDFVSLHVALTPETQHLINSTRLALMKKTAVLINTARGAVVDERALVEALRGGRLGAAALDVYEKEPRVHPSLMEMENVVLAPHLGSATRQTREAMGLLAANNLIAALRGRRPSTPVLFNGQRP